MKRILVIGAGLIGGRHVDTILAHPDCALAGVVDPASSRRPSHGAPWFQDISEVDVPVDGAVIASPTGLHGSHGEAVAARGWDMLIEKPVTVTVAEAEALELAVKGAGVCALVGHHRRYHASIRKLKDIVAEGAIGGVVTSTMIWSLRKPDAYFETDWRQKAGSPVMINLIHDIDLLRFVLGEIVDVTGFASQAARLAGRVESGAVALRFASGACGTISFADVAPSPWGFEAGTAENPNIAATGQDMWWITGTKGAVSFPSIQLWSGAQDWSQVPQMVAHETAETVPLVAQLDHFVDVMERQSPPLIDIRDGQRSLEITEKVEACLARDIETQSRGNPISA